ncbi:hypothetical protein HCC45_00625 [Streptococcus suis]|nr:hypothetical protein [Streptococcus suis]
MKDETKLFLTPARHGLVDAVHIKGTRQDKGLGRFFKFPFLVLSRELLNE